jgi:hypothetical protein
MDRKIEYLVKVMYPETNSNIKMVNEPKSYTDRQLKTLDALQRVKMSWFVFWIFLTLFVATSLCLSFFSFLAWIPLSQNRNAAD